MRRNAARSISSVRIITEPDANCSSTPPKLFSKKKICIRWKSQVLEMFRVATLHFGDVASCELVVVQPRCNFANIKKSFALHATFCAYAEEKHENRTSFFYHLVISDFWFRNSFYSSQHGLEPLTLQAIETFHLAHEPAWSAARAAAGRERE